MKNKLIGLAVCLVVLAASFTAAGLENGRSTRYHQHQEQPGYTPCADHGEEVFCSHLPLILIETGGQAIPGEPLDSFEGTNETFSTAPDGGKTISVSVRVLDESEQNHHLDEKPSIETQANIRIRGNSSRYFDKKSYLLHLTDQTGERIDLPLLGMDAHDEWALYGPYLDKSLIRNYMWYNIAGEMMDYAPNVRFCEVFLDGVYQGLYVLTETITNGENCRVNISKPIENTDRTGYILRLDRGSSVPVKNVTTFTQYTLRNLQDVNIVYPGGDHLTPALADAIAQDFSDFEKSLYSFDYNTGEYAYWNYADVDSFVNYFIINEFTCNYDSGWLSTYIYKDVGGKYKMCIWDFNSACDNYTQSSIALPQHFEIQKNVWYYMMSKDDRFIEAIIDRYRALRETWLSDEYLEQYIDDTITWLGPAVDRNFERWGYTFDIDMLQPAERNPRSHEEAVTQMKAFIKMRGAWLDEHIDILKQYSHPSKVKKFNH